MPKTRTDQHMPVALTEQSQGLWIDAEVMACIHGTSSKLSAPHITSDQERLLHYADICLGTAKPDEIKSKKPVRSQQGKIGRNKLRRSEAKVFLILRADFAEGLPAN
jgi:hypothetical protein